MADVPGLLLSRDLLFTVKIASTARELGAHVQVAGNVDLASALIAKIQPRAVFVDLAAGPLVANENLALFQEQAGADTPFIAFGSHVDAEALEAARAAGCREVMPRSKFTVQLPDLIRRYLTTE
ncbi:response regulator [Paludisphaera mucosa]|uniref:Response regulator n=1 Tax=Paludisphaera mucosa TaxID=3030827 RepID=A0ABT6F7G4_9BACT|nr:response regulator [Paludisphaera mucosa]MDG3003464.1 response regulator [Paludisphaera mucosa]